MVSERGIVPAGLGVAEQVEGFHDSFRIGAWCCRAKIA
jgi:hypothetical protein